MENQGRSTLRPPRGSGAGSPANPRRPSDSPTGSPLTGGMIVPPPAGAVHDVAPANSEAEAPSQARAAASEAQPRLDLHSTSPPPKKKKKGETSHSSIGRRGARAVAGGSLNSGQTSAAGSRASDACNNPWQSTTTHPSLRIGGIAGCSGPGRKSLAPPAIKGVGGGGEGRDRDGRFPGSPTLPGSRTAHDAWRMSLRAPMFAGAGASEGGGSSNNTTSGAGFGRGRPAEDTKRCGLQDGVKAGNVQAMCPLKEQTTRLAESAVHILEKDPSGQELEHGHCLVKRYQRSAAGVDVGQSDLMRTPLWLARTVDHLVVECMDKGAHGGGDLTLAFNDPRVQDFLATFRRKNPSRAHLAEQEAGLAMFDFVSNRLRMVRSEYRMQGYNSVDGVVSESCIVAHERMARWYVLMAIRMADNPLVHRFNDTAIVETLKLLCELYEILGSRGKLSGGLASPNEPEMIGLYLLAVSRRDGGLEMNRVVRRFSKGNRQEVLDSPEMKGVLRLLRAWQNTEYLKFFRELRLRGSMMQRCLLPPYVQDIRNGAMKMIAQAWSDMPVPELQRILGFRDDVEAVAFAKAYGVPVIDGNVLVRKKEAGKWINTFRQPCEIPEMMSTQEFVEPTPWQKASEVVCRGDEQSVADRSHCTAPLAESSDNVQPVCDEMAAGGRVSVQGAWVSERTATAQCTGTDLSSYRPSSSASPAASVADRNLSAQLPAPGATVDPPLSSTSRSAVPSSTVSTAGRSHAQYSQETMSAAAHRTKVSPKPLLQLPSPSGETTARVSHRPPQGEEVDVSTRTPSPARAVAAATSTAVGKIAAESIVAGSVTASTSTAATTSDHHLFVRFQRFDNITPIYCDPRLFVRVQRTDNTKGIAKFAKFFENCFGAATHVNLQSVRNGEPAVLVSGKRKNLITTVAGYMQHAIRVCREGPWQPTSFCLAQVRLPAHGEDSATSRFVISPPAKYPKGKRLLALSNTHGVVTMSLNASEVGALAVGVDPHPSAESGLPRLCAPPDAAVDKVVQLWGLHHAVESALDNLLFNVDEVPTSLRLGRRIVGQLAKIEWPSKVGTKVMLDEESGTLSVERSTELSLAAITDTLLTKLPRSIQLVDMVDAAVMRNVAAPDNLEALARVDGGRAGDISVLPVWLTTSVLVLAPGEEALEKTVGEVHLAVTRAVQQSTATRVRVPLNGLAVANKRKFKLGRRNSRKAERYFFRQGFTDNLAEAVSDLGVDLWLDGQCLCTSRRRCFEDAC